MLSYYIIFHDFSCLSCLSCFQLSIRFTKFDQFVENINLLFIKQKFFFSTVSNYSSLSKRLEKILEHLFANVPKIQLDCPSLIKDG